MVDVRRATLDWRLSLSEKSRTFRDQASERRTSGLILHDEGAVCAPSARPGGLANADGVPERAHIDKSSSPGKAKSARPGPRLQPGSRGGSRPATTGVTRRSPNFANAARRQTGAEKVKAALIDSP
jgi:hypothetical protein